MRIVPVFLVSGILASTACSTAGVNADTVKTHGEYCAGINLLMTSYSDSFRSIRTKRQTTRFMDIWSTDFHIVGNSCEIWDWGQNKINYICSKTFPDEDVAFKRYERAKQIAGECLTGWQMQEGPRESGDGVKVVYKNNNEQPVLAVHAVPTKALFRSEWSVYVFVGNVEESSN